MSFKTDARLGSAILSVMLAWSGAAVAQTQPADPAPAAQPTEDAVEDGEVVVTAQRREERLQDVPISVTALSEQRLEDLNIRDLSGIQQATPGMTFSSGISYTQTYIRGLGSSFTNPGLEPAVATYIDGAYVERGFGALFDILDPASVQVLRGPQGTLWGRNATGGAILIDTADPEIGQFGGRLSSEIGNLEHSLVEGVLNVPLGPTLAARFSGRYRNDGGYIRNLVDGYEFGARENWTARAKLAWEPNTDFSAVLQYQHDESERSPGANAEYLDAGFCALCGTSTYAFPISDPYTTVGNTLNNGVGGVDESDFFSLRTRYELGSFSLSSATGYRDMANFETGDFDFTEQQVFNLVQWSGAKTFTQELSVASNFDGIFNFIAGLSYLDDESDFSLGGYSTDITPPRSTGANFGNNIVNTESTSIYAEGTIEPSPGLRLTVGGRYTEDERELEGIESRSFDGFTPRVVVSYDTGPLNLYVSYNEGFKAGGFNTPAAGPPANSVEPEEIASYEAGIKYVSPDRRFRGNLSVFTYENTNIQVTVIDQLNGGSVLQNAAEAEGQGAELDFEYQALDALHLFGGVAYLDAHYTDYQNAQVQEPVYGPGNVPAGLVVGFEDLTGFPLSRAPEWTFFLGGTLSTQLTDNWVGELTVFARYTSEYDFAPGAGGPLRGDRQDELTTMRLSGRVMPEDERYEIGFFVENLTDEVYYDFRFTTAPFGGMQYVARPRTYGLRLGVNF